MPEPTTLRAAAHDTVACMAECPFVFATMLPAEAYTYTGLGYTSTMGPTYSTTESV